jgi:hypothetical protein
MSEWPLGGALCMGGGEGETAEKSPECGRLNGLVRLTFGSCLTPAPAPIVCLVPIRDLSIRSKVGFPQGIGAELT